MGWEIQSQYRSISRWQHRNELPPRGISRFWRLYLPLAVDFCPVILAWMVLPAQFDTPMDAIALFVPDVFMFIVIVTTLSLGWVVVRTILTLRSRWLMNHVRTEQTAALSDNRL